MDDNYDYELLADDMDELGCIVSAAEYHGMVSGRLIGGPWVQGRAWRDQGLELLGLAPEQADSADLRRLLALPEQVMRELQQQDYSFQLLLPADDGELRLRAEELAHWCQGFLSGLALAGQDQQRWSAMPPELAEGLTDLASIAQLEMADSDTDNDYAELFEYVRMVALNAHAELAVSQDTTAAPVHNASALFQGKHKLH
jgi:hypothetical protein